MAGKIATQFTGVLLRIGYYVFLTGTAHIVFSVLECAKNSAAGKTYLSYYNRNNEILLQKQPRRTLGAEMLKVMQKKSTESADSMAPLPRKTDPFASFHTGLDGINRVEKGRMRTTQIYLYK